MVLSNSYVGAVDQGTSSSRFIVFDEHANVVASHQVEFEQIYPEPGWCEHDPFVLWNTVKECIEKTCQKMVEAGLDVSNIQAIGITNQRETTIVWDKNTGKPLHNAIVWHDTRTTETVHHLINSTTGKDKNCLAPLCGLPIATYFSAVKLKWLLDNVADVREASEGGNLCFGTVDSWLIYNMTGGVKGGVHCTDVTNASRTMLMDIQELKWSNKLCQFFNISKSCLPEIKPSSSVYGFMNDGPLKGVPISGCLGDQQAAMVGQKCFSVGDAKNTYGTGCFMLFNTGNKVTYSTHGLLSTVCYQFGSSDPVYALEGSVAVAGSCVKFLRDNFGMIQDAPEINSLASQVEDTAGVYFVPAFSGLFAPYWRDDARGCIVGITQFTRKEHLARAVIEAVCYQTRDILEAMNNDSGHSLRVLKVDGGLTNSDLCMQVQANLIGIDVVRPMMRETTALGAAFAAGLAVGVWEDISTLQKLSSDEVDIFKSQMSESERKEKCSKWKMAVERSLNWA